MAIGSINLSCIIIIYRTFFLICMHYSNNKDEADEIFQQSMIKIFNPDY